ncbi:hypothetical protein C0995_014407 [Termitomyces sp. Mi166|nr:hypothetical protein C0995_014407 [Termitomyces sp. Mi166\
MTSIQDDKLYAFTNRLKDRVVVITGAGNGIGRETALQAASAKVVIGDLDVTGAEKTVRDIEAAGGIAVSQKCNVTVWDDQIALFELAIAKFGVVDIVMTGTTFKVPNAGVTEIGSFHKVSFKNGKPVKPDTRTIDVNLFGVIYTTHLALHYLNVKRGVKDDALKAVVLIGSVASWLGLPHGAMYAASKHGVLGLMRSLYPEFALNNIRIATIHPFFADTKIVPLPVKVLLAGIPLAPVPRIAGAIIHAATNPDPETNGVAFLLNDDGPVFMVPREEFKFGVYKMIDERSNKLLRGGAGAIYYARLVRDYIRILGKPVLLAAFVASATKLTWDHRELVLEYIHKSRTLQAQTHQELPDSRYVPSALLAHSPVDHTAYLFARFPASADTNPHNRGESLPQTNSAASPACSQEATAARLESSREEQIEHTEHLPSLAKTLAILSVNDVHDCMAIIVILAPDVADPALATEIPELEDRGRQRDCARCGQYEGRLRGSCDNIIAGTARTILPDGGHYLVCWESGLLIVERLDLLEEGL